ncbi:hypothetical protein EX30DRAFT_330465 [Ascodesmis nigricans]|uniref:AB hydrolase-1 domain-containing protein n=1 Tax=Ascodesmis nigricans TaxID=341454 RepID=A0A4S2MZ00_9PEZI|nr:hypothetical protein EX30DRAFT_330465 [Ascodesmis nigricans]
MTHLRPPFSPRPRSSNSFAHRPPNLSAPLNLQIPSLHDANPLETILQAPDYNTVPFRRQIAIVAHPYAVLGGSLHDFVVTHLAATLLEVGFVVVTFNFRGAGRTKGRTSWTGRPERGDYAAVAAWALQFIRNLAEPPVSSANGLAEQKVPQEQARENINLLLAGYSYGALIAASCPPLSALEEAIEHPPSKEFGTSVVAAAKSARRWHDSHSNTTRTSYSGHRPRMSLDAPMAPSPAPPPLLSRPVNIRYLLISPVLSWLAPTILALRLPWEKVPSVLDVQHAKERSQGMMVVWGGKDTFTGVSAYQDLQQRMRREWDGFVGVEVLAAGHFWAEPDISTVQARIKKWASQF